jgi:antitoxin CcdA
MTYMPAVAAKAPKKPANVSVRADLLTEAKALGLNLSRTLEAALEQAIREKRRQSWLTENHEALEAYQRHIEREGLFADRFRAF